MTTTVHTITLAMARRIADAAKSPQTGRTEDGPKNDAEMDKAYRAKAGQQTPQVKADPWADVRTPPTEPASKTKK